MEPYISLISPAPIFFRDSRPALMPSRRQQITSSTYKSHILTILDKYFKILLTIFFVENYTPDPLHYRHPTSGDNLQVMQLIYIIPFFP